MTTLPESPPPPYVKTAQPSRPTPNVNILILGSPGVGKSTFLSALPHVRNGRLEESCLEATDSKSSPLRQSSVSNPSTFSVSLFNRPYDVNIYRSESTLFIDPFPSKIDFAILCYAVDSRESLYNCQFYWRKQFADRYERELGLTVPVMLLGLKRDLRTDATRTVDGATAVVEIGGIKVGASSGGGIQKSEAVGKQEYVCVMPREGLQAAQQMRCDKYAECSAFTGELMWEVLEDITRIAALTTTEKGGLSEGNCVVM